MTRYGYFMTRIGLGFGEVIGKKWSLRPVKGSASSESASKRPSSLRDPKVTMSSRVPGRTLRSVGSSPVNCVITNVGTPAASIRTIDTESPRWLAV